MKRVYLHMKEAEAYPLAAVKSGLKVLGYTHVRKTDIHTLTPDDLLVTWSAWKGGVVDRLSQIAKANGVPHIMLENGWLPESCKLRWRTFQVALGGWNGTGTLKLGDPGRPGKFNIDLKPWHWTGDYVLVCAQRGTVEGDPATHGKDWIKDIVARLLEATDLPIAIRPHPGNKRDLEWPIHPRVTVLDRTEPLERHLSRAAACVVYSSTAAVQALMAGVPVFLDGNRSIVRAGCETDLSLIGKPVEDRREQAFYIASWSLWSELEIASGAAFSWLLQ